MNKTLQFGHCSCDESSVYHCLGVNCVVPQHCFRSFISNHLLIHRIKSTQNQGEIIDQFCIMLKQKVKHCNFGDTSDDNIRDQIVDK